MPGQSSSSRPVFPAQTVSTDSSAVSFLQYLPKIIVDKLPGYSDAQNHSG